MRFAEILRAICVLAVGLGFVGCQEGPSTGYGMNRLPDTAPGRAEVLQAATSVIQELYPQTAASEEGGFVYALTPVAMNGGSKTRKQISVMVIRNFTGAYEPVVRVRQYVDVGSPQLGANPQSGNVGLAAPLADNEWQALDYLPYEEQALYDAIVARIATPAPAPDDSQPAPSGSAPAETAQPTPAPPRPGTES